MAKKEYKVWLKALYTVFLAILIALFFGLGVAAFYEGPKNPQMEVFQTEPICKDGVENAESKAEREQKEADFKSYQEKNAVYSRNVSMITLGLALIAVIAGILLTNKISLISDSLMLGGVFTLIYSIIRGFESEDAKFRFIIVTIGLVITVGLGYIKFIKNKGEEK